MKYGLILAVVSAIVMAGYISNGVTKRKYEYDMQRNGNMVSACKVNGTMPYYVTIYEYYRIDGQPDGTLSIARFLSFYGSLYDEGRVRREYDSATIDSDGTKWDKVESLYK